MIERPDLRSEAGPAGLEVYQLTVEALPERGEELLEKILNELSRGEIINRGVIWCPEPRFYPVSLERFIVSVLDREFK